MTWCLIKRAQGQFHLFIIIVSSARFMYTLQLRNLQSERPPKQAKQTKKLTSLCDHLLVLAHYQKLLIPQMKERLSEYSYMTERHIAKFLCKKICLTLLSSCKHHRTFQRITVAISSSERTGVGTAPNAVFIGASAKNSPVGFGSSRHSNSQHLSPARNLLQNYKT